MAVAFVAGASILRVSASAASPFSSAESPRAVVAAPAPKPSPEAIGGAAPRDVRPRRVPGRQAVALSETPPACRPTVRSGRSGSRRRVPAPARRD